LQTCPHATFQRQSTMYGLNNLAKWEHVYMLGHWMTMFKLSNNWHCILISSKVIDQVKGLVRMT
jgi:hypothetical protein